jgi:hypothetical protein
MSNQIQTQATKVWQTVFDPETAGTYKKTATTTWTLLKESGYLLWLVVCLVLVAGEWIWKTGYKTGWGVRQWVNNLEKPSTDQLLSSTGKNLLSAGKSGLAIALSTAKDQLGIEYEPEPVEVIPTVKAAKPIEEPAKVTPEPATAPSPTKSSADPEE